MTIAAVGFRVHSGWAAAVTILGPVPSPRAIDRRRIELADGSSASRQPFHAAEKLGLPEAEELIQRHRTNTSRLARQALEAIGQAHPVSACGLVTAAGRPLPELPAILASHALIHTAEGQFFREALAGAAREQGLPVRLVKERELLQACADELRLAPARIQEHLAGWGAALGSPWRQDEKYAALAAWLALAAGAPAQRLPT